MDDIRPRSGGSPLASHPWLAAVLVDPAIERGERAICRAIVAHHLCINKSYAVLSIKKLMNQTGFSGDGIKDILAAFVRRKFLRRLDYGGNDMMFCLLIPEKPQGPKIPIAKPISAREEILHRVGR